MKPNPTKISQSEWDIMEVLWREAPLSASEIFAHLATKTSWNEKTVRSFLDRLVGKRALRKTKLHGVNVFRPLLDRQKCLIQESRSFLDRFFQGNPISLVSHFLEHEGLAPDELLKLQNVLESRLHGEDE